MVKSDVKSISMSRLCVCIYTFLFFFTGASVDRTQGIFEILDEYNIESYFINIWFPKSYVMSNKKKKADTHTKDNKETSKSEVFCMTVYNIKVLFRIKSPLRRRRGRGQPRIDLLDMTH